MTALNLDSLSFATHAQNQGQIVTVSYACDEDRIVRRAYDASDRTTSYDVADLDWSQDDHRWAEWETYEPVNGAPPKSWGLEWVSVDETGRPLATLYTYSVYDSDPTSSSVDAWPDATDIEVEADDAEDAIAEARDYLEAAAAGLSVSDGYDVGQTIYAIVRSHDDTIVGTPTYTLTAEDLSATKSAAHWERGEAAACYTAKFPTDNGEGECKVRVEVGSVTGLWYIRTVDDAGGSDDCDDTAYQTREDAVEAAEKFASEMDEG